MIKLTVSEIKINSDLLGGMKHTLFSDCYCQVLYNLLQGKQGHNELVTLLEKDGNANNVNKVLKELQKQKYIVKVAVHTVLKKADYVVTALGEGLRGFIDTLIAHAIEEKRKK